MQAPVSALTRGPVHLPGAPSGAGEERDLTWDSETLRPADWSGDPTLQLRR